MKATTRVRTSPPLTVSVTALPRASPPMCSALSWDVQLSTIIDQSDDYDDDGGGGGGGGGGGDGDVVAMSSFSVHGSLDVGRHLFILHLHVEVLKIINVVWCQFRDFRCKVGRVCVCGGGGRYVGGGGGVEDHQRGLVPVQGLSL